MGINQDQEQLRFCLIIGAMKCATSSMFTLLSQHPEIAACSEKEPNFFAFPRRFANGFDWYLELWDKSDLKDKILMEASTGYAWAPVHKAAENIRRTQDETGAEFKFIYVMRNPVDRVVSHYKHRRDVGRITAPLEEVLRSDHEIMEVSRYAMQLDAYDQRFGRENILLLLFEDFRQDPGAVLGQICDFLGLDPEWDFKDQTVIHNPTRGRRFNLLEKKLKASVWGLKHAVRIIPKSIRCAVSNALCRLMDAEATLSDEQRALIVGFLREDIEKLESKYGVDISRWGLLD